MVDPTAHNLLPPDKRWWYPKLFHALDPYGAAFVGKSLVASDVCWVCQRKFDQNLTDHDHHIIPRAFGGADGPQVRICSPHHQLLHALATVLVANGRVTVADLDVPTAERVMFLASRAAMAELRTEAEPNKRILTSFYLSQTDNAALAKRLARTTPRLSKQALMETLVKRFLSS